MNPILDPMSGKINFWPRIGQALPLHIIKYLTARDKLFADFLPKQIGDFLYINMIKT